MMIVRTRLSDIALGLFVLWEAACLYRVAGATDGVALAVLESAGPQIGATVERWGTLELSIEGPVEGNPFVDNHVGATFTPANGGESEALKVDGFYDGDGVYRIRFSPPASGRWTYVTHSNLEALANMTGQFEVGPASKSNHGSVHVHNTFHFAYSDGKPYKPIGTTCYAWTSQPEELQVKTLETLASAPFNKLRMCVFPKLYAWNENEPPLFPFAGAPRSGWEFSEFNPEFFQQFERRILQLRDLGIEADVILFHPYDEGHWGFDRMPDDADDRYVRYLVSRLASFRNVWWSLANEYDFMLEKTESDWDRLIEVLDTSDPYNRLTSIHNGRVLYNHSNPQLTHASIQNGSACEDAGRAVLYRDVYRKPIVFDEVKYEGDIPKRWGNLSPQELVHRFWQGTIAGTYVGHGETYLSDDDVLWWSKGGVLKGESPARLAFLRNVLEGSPSEGIEPIDKWQEPRIGGKAGAFYLLYFGKESPKEWKFELPRYELADGMTFKVEIIDAWNMTIDQLPDVFTAKQLSEYVFQDASKRVVRLPGRPYLALRIIRTGAG